MSDRPADKPKRRRRSPEVARRAILDAAGGRLKRDGPDGLRLQTIAADLGITHSSILHHFGSREGLLEALSNDAFESLDRDLRASLESPPSGQDRGIEVLERAAETLRDQGHARLLAWQIMSGRLPDTRSDSDGGSSDDMLARIAELVHRARVEILGELGMDPPEIEDTRFYVLMMAYSLFAEALAGDVLAASAGLDTSAEGHRRFHRWLAEKGQSLILPTTDEDERR